MTLRNGLTDWAWQWVRDGFMSAFGECTRMRSLKKVVLRVQRWVNVECKCERGVFLGDLFEWSENYVESVILEKWRHYWIQRSEIPRNPYPSRFRRFSELWGNVWGRSWVSEFVDFENVIISSSLASLKNMKSISNMSITIYRFRGLDLRSVKKKKDSEYSISKKWWFYRTRHLKLPRNRYPSRLFTFLKFWGTECLREELKWWLLLSDLVKWRFYRSQHLKWPRNLYQSWLFSFLKFRGNTWGRSWNDDFSCSI